MPLAPIRLGAALAAGLATLLVGAPVPASARVAAPAGGAEPRVLAISVDGLNTAAIRRLGAERAPTLHRLIGEGASTLNARTAHEKNVTLPNHTGMLTGRRIDAEAGGHGVTWNDDRPDTTVHRAAVDEEVASVFSMVELAGGESALFTTKEKFELFDRSWPITRFVVDARQRRLVGQARRDLLRNERDFTFLHVSLPDRLGHRHGGMTRPYLKAVRRTDRHLGRVVDAITATPRLRRSTTVVLTADHGFIAGRERHRARLLPNYRIPFAVWSRGGAAGDLYELNPDYRDPGRAHPAYGRARQPVRNADLGNLALDLLGLGPIPGSQINSEQRLDID